MTDAVVPSNAFGANDWYLSDQSDELVHNMNYPSNSMMFDSFNTRGFMQMEEMKYGNYAQQQMYRGNSGGFMQQQPDMFEQKQMVTQKFETPVSSMPEAETRPRRTARRPPARSQKRKAAELTDDEDGSDNEDCLPKNFFTDQQFSGQSIEQSAADIAKSKYNDVKDEKERKRLKRLLRNRVSAQLARERKKAYLTDLEGKMKEIEDKNEALEMRVSQLTQENFLLRQNAKKVDLSSKQNNIFAFGSDEEDFLLHSSEEDVLLVPN